MWLRFRYPRILPVTSRQRSQNMWKHRYNRLRSNSLPFCRPPPYRLALRLKGRGGGKPVTGKVCDPASGGGEGTIGIQSAQHQYKLTEDILFRRPVPLVVTAGGAGVEALKILDREDATLLGGAEGGALGVDTVLARAGDGPGGGGGGAVGGRGAGDEPERGGGGPGGARGGAGGGDGVAREPSSESARDLGGGAGGAAMLMGLRGGGGGAWREGKSGFKLDGRAGGGGGALPGPCPCPWPGGGGGTFRAGTCGAAEDGRDGISGTDRVEAEDAVREGNGGASDELPLIVGGGLLGGAGGAEGGDGTDLDGKLGAGLLGGEGALGAGGGGAAGLAGLGRLGGGGAGLEREGGAGGVAGAERLGTAGGLPRVGGLAATRH